MQSCEFVCFLAMLTGVASLGGAAESGEDPSVIARPVHEAIKSDFKPLASEPAATAGALGNLDVASRSFAVLRAVDVQRRRVTVLIDGETEPKEWPLREGAEIWFSGWWGRLDQFTPGDRIWLWFAKSADKQPHAISFFADELSEQHLYAPFKVKSIERQESEGGTLTLDGSRGGKPVVRTVGLTGAEFYRNDDRARLASLSPGELLYVQTTGSNARVILDGEAFEKRRSDQQLALRDRWIREGLPGTLVFLHPDRHELEVILDHEALHWGRTLQAGDKVTLGVAGQVSNLSDDGASAVASGSAQPGEPVPAQIRHLRPWRERTQILLSMEGMDASGWQIGQRLTLRLPSLPAPHDAIPPGLRKSQSKAERVEWLMSGTYCTCGMHDACAGHIFTLAACQSQGASPCGLAKRTRGEIGSLIDEGRSDQEIFEQLLQPRGPKVLRPHMAP